MFNNLLLSIGTIKGGTTWLYSQLKDHPQINLTPEKEIHYFYASKYDPNILSNERRLASFKRVLDARIEQYEKQENIKQKNKQYHLLVEQMAFYQKYLAPTISDEWFNRLFLSDRHNYMADFGNLNSLLSEEDWIGIRRKTNKLRVLYTIRDPRKRLWSHIKFHFMFTGKSEEDVLKMDPSEFASWCDKKYIRVHGEYAAVIKKLQNTLTPKQYKVLVFEQIHQNPLATLRDIEQFLDILPNHYSENQLKKRVNTTKSLSVPDNFQPIVNEYARKTMNDLNRIGFEFPESWDF